MQFMSDFREAMWGVVQRVVSELDFDFDATPSSTSTGCSRPPPTRAFETWLDEAREPAG